jgi:hypothetical protein
MFEERQNILHLMRKLCGSNCLMIRCKHMPCFHYRHVVLISKYKGWIKSSGNTFIVLK